MFCAAGKHLRQGDVVKSINFPQVGGSFPAVCLTPICDLTPQEKSGGKIKADYVLFCLLIPDVEFFKKDFSPKSGKTKKSVIGEIKNYITGRFPRYHWIYNPEKEKGYMIDYQVVHSLPYSQAEKCEIIASLQSSYKEDLATRYAFYSGRIGTEDLAHEKIAEAIAVKLGY